MNFKKLGLALTISAAFGLMACGDDSSSNASNVINCKVTKSDYAFNTTSTYNGQTATIDITIDENGLLKYVEVSPIEDEEDKENCANSEEGDIITYTCKDGIITTVSQTMISVSGSDEEKAEIRKETIKGSSALPEAFCLASNGKTPEELIGDDEE